MKTIAIVTGASSGLGREFVKQLDSDDKLDEIWICARRKELLQNLSYEINIPTKIIAGDVTDQSWLKNLSYYLENDQVQIHTLVNSAGLGKTGSFASIGLEDNAYMIEVNILALTKICSVCLPYMMSQGRILNVASVAAFLPQANFAVYAATKAYVLSLSRAMNQELKDKMITVTAVCPNPVETEFFLNTGGKSQYDSLKNIGLEEVETVVSVALKKSEQKKDISISSLIAKSIQLISRIMPHPFILKISEFLGIS
ncbi:MAG: SDR family NAD(P)-dependent oxidoreductase [Clostridiaceae bacterium]|nr:SDR family NAD(P)-dependent oxidoreductase [Clostridiaceae bacterium]